MIVYFLGIPGSGKTYYGVNVIYDNFVLDIPKKSKLSLKKDYENCYTNINEFKFNLTKNVFPLDFDDFYSKLEILYNMYKKKCTDNELIEKARELNIYKTLFVIDECHNFFDVADKVKIWWLTYHRHLYHDVYLITQNLSLVNSKYKPLAEAFYKAKSSSLTLNKKYFNYMYFTESRMTKASYVNTLKVLKRKEVFKLYKSGDKVESKNVILRFIKISIILFIILICIALYFYFQKTKQIDNAKKNITIEKTINNNGLNSKQKNINDNINDNIEKDLNDDNQRLAVFVCDKVLCSYDNIEFSTDVLKFANQKYEVEKISGVKRFNKIVLTYSVSEDFLNFLKHNGSNNDVSIIDKNKLTDNHLF